MTASPLPLERPLGQAVVAALDAALGAGRAGYATIPSGVGVQGGTFVPYALVYPGGGAGREGTAAAPNADADQLVQVTYVGVDADQADLVRDTGRTALLTPGALAVTGRYVGVAEVATSRAATRDTTVIPPVWYAIDIYQIPTTPA